MKKYYLFASLVLIAASPAFAQTKIGAPGAPDGSAMLEVTSGTSGNKGLLLPRMTVTQRNAIAAPATGLMIYNTTANQVQVNTGTPAAPIWVIATATNSGWDLVGNSGTTPATNFIGTTDNQPLVVRTDNTEKVRVTSTGNVGIGVASPGTKLHVSDTGDVAIRVASTDGSKAAIQLGNPNHGLIRNLTASGGGPNDVAVYTSLGSSGGSDLHLISNPVANGSDSLPIDQFVLKNTGDIGIGTNTPAQKLHVEGTARIATAVGTPTTITGRNAAGDVGNVTLGSGLSLTGGVLNTTADNADWNLTGNTGTNPATNFIGTGDAQPLVIRTSNTEKVRVTAAGNIGIGTTSPTQKLQVTDTSDASVLVTAPAGKQMRVLLGSANHGMMRNLTSSGGNSNDVALYTSSGTGAAGAGDVYLVANPTANGSDSLPIDQFVLKNTGNVGIGTNAPAQKLHVQGTARISTAVGTPTTITGRSAAGDVGNVTLGSGLSLTAGVLNTTADNADWNLTGNAGTNPATNFIGTSDAQPLVIRTSNTEKVRVTAAGNVGIGTASPAFTLDVNGSIKANNDVLTASTSGSAMAWNSVNSGLGETELINYKGTGGGGFRFYSLAPSVVPAAGVGELMRITGTGNVGIGTATPAAKLDVNGTARISTAVGTPTTITGRNAAGDVGNVTVGSGLALTAGVLTAAPVADNTDWELTGNTGTNPATNFIGTSDNQALAFRTNNTEQVRVTAAGDVGIGTQNPSSKLNVNEGALNVSTTAPMSSAAIQIINDGGGGGGNDDIRISSFGAGVNPIIFFRTARGTASAPANAQTGDNLGVINFGTYVNGGPTGLNTIRSIYLGDGTTDKSSLNFYMNQLPRLTIDSSGWVGIGTPHPTAELSVQGAANNVTGVWSIFSDARVKTVDGEYEDGLATVMKIHPVKFHYNANAPFKSKEQQIGIIAQEMEQIAPYMVSKVNADGFNDLRQYNNQALPYMLVNAIQEQQAQIEVLKVKNEQLEAKNEQLEAVNKITAQLMERVKQMEQMMGINEIEGTSKIAGK